ncbi:alpha/beta fold hydrolase [Nocardia sp. NPDC057663]|uniref:thioesterase domain-containing protein n=1 Tax=Nocardia sp. NPDC057663 TaxID=3346201 RepID=UPI00366C7BB3
MSRPRDMVEYQVGNIIAELLKLEPERINHDTDFFASGGNSFLAGALIGRIERALGAQVSLKEILSKSTVAEIAVNCRRAIGAENREDLLFDLGDEPAGNTQNVFFVHGRSGEVYFLQPAISLARKTRRSFPVVAIRSRGLDGKHEPLQTIEQMADLYAAKIVQHQPQGPYTLAGFCLGGMIAWAVAQRLITRGSEVRELLLFDTVPSDQALQASEKSLLVDGTHPLLERLAKTHLSHSETTFGVSTWADIVAEFHEHSLLPLDVTPAHFQRRMQVTGRNLVAFLDYRPSKVDTKIRAVFGSSVDDQDRSAATSTYRGLSRAADFQTVDSEHGEFFASEAVFKMLSKN